MIMGFSDDKCGFDLVRWAIGRGGAKRPFYPPIAFIFAGKKGGYPVVRIAGWFSTCPARNVGHAFTVWEIREDLGYIRQHLGFG